MQLPYCKNCGAKLDETVRFCPSCGASVTGRAAQGRVVERKRPGRFFALFLTAILLATVLFGFLFFLPIRPVSLQVTHSVPLGAGVHAVVVDLSVDVGDVNVAFRDLAGEAVRLDFSVSGFGRLISPQMPAISFQQEPNGNILSVTIKVGTSFLHSLWNLAFLKVDCDFIIDQSLNATINVKTGMGKITFETRSGVIVNSLKLETTTGAVEASLVEDTVVTGDMSIKTVTGALSFSWRNVIVEREVAVDLGSVTGATSVNIMQDERLRNRVDLGVEVTTGAIDLTLAIGGDVAGRITSSTTTGSVNVQRSDDFSGLATQLQSNNYPSNSRFDINLQTTTGGIRIDARHTL
jgi:hypothetical protein